MAPAAEDHGPTGLSGLSPGVLAGIFAVVGVIVIAVPIIAFLLIRERKKHKRLLGDMEVRGVNMAQSQAQARDSQQQSVPKPRSVLRRHALLPFSAKSRWDALPSRETINNPDQNSAPDHYAPPKPSGSTQKSAVPKSSRLSWPFSARRASGKSIHLRKIRVPTLSTVLESPKPSPLVPVLGGSLSREGSSRKSQTQGRPSSDQSLLQKHPAFRNAPPEELAAVSEAESQEDLRRSFTWSRTTPKKDVPERTSRSRSMAELASSSTNSMLSRLSRGRSHARSPSVCSQTSGNAPNAPIPPLPLDVALVMSEAKRRSLLSRSPSRFSVSSFESVGSSIIHASKSSPILPRPHNVRVQKMGKREWRHSPIAGPRPLRDTLILHGKNKPFDISIKDSNTGDNATTPAEEELPPIANRNSTLTNSSSLQSLGNVKTAESMTVSKVYSPPGSPLNLRNISTPRRHSGSNANAFGSPAERRKVTVFRGPGDQGGPERQLSQTSTQASSTRSSNGNPFQWDPTPLFSGKPSALRGSPGARKGRRRQNCVRIALAPTILGPQSRSQSPSGMNDIKEESPTISSEKRNGISGIGLDFSVTHTLMGPPSTSTFAPEVNFGTTTIRASLTPSSPTLSMANYDHGPVGSPHPNHPKNSSEVKPNNRLSGTSVFSIPSFPSPGHGIGSIQSISTPPPTFALSRASGELVPRSMSQSSLVSSSPFEALIPDLSLLTDEHDPENPQIVFQTPDASPKRPSGLRITTIAEQSSSTTRSADFTSPRSADSPPCSPKTERPNSKLPHSPRQQPPERSSAETAQTIDPAILSNDTFATLHSNFRDPNTSTPIESAQCTRSDTPIPSTPPATRNAFEPLLEAVFPSSPPVQNHSDHEETPFTKRARASTYASLIPLLGTPRPASPFTLTVASQQSSPDSVYLTRCQSPESSSQIPPGSPRPRHAQLPTPNLNFMEVPTLNPSPFGPRDEPPMHLRDSIQKLRRMNSDAENGGRGERRYRRFGRQPSVALPGDESWLEDLSQTFEDEESLERRLVGHVLDECEEEEEEAIEHDENTPTQAGASPSQGSSTPVQDATRSSSDTVDRPSVIFLTSSPQNTNRPSSIWEDGDKFWHSTPPHPPNSPNKPRDNFLPSSSPSTPHQSQDQNISPSHSAKGEAASTASTPNTRKRDFSVAKDGSPSASPKSVQQKRGSGNGIGKREKGIGKRFRKRSVLGVGTPNVKIGACPPSESSQGTSASLYDTDGFLR